MGKFYPAKRQLSRDGIKIKLPHGGRIKSGEKVYFKKSGGLVCAVAKVGKVLQFDGLNLHKVRMIVKKYGGVGRINLTDPKGYRIWAKGKNYCILIFLKNPRSVAPFKIDKRGLVGWLLTQSLKSR